MGTGVFKLDDDETDVKEAQWMLYQALIVEDMCELPDIETCVASDTDDRDELLHEAMLHFNQVHVAPWNLALVVETEMLGFAPFKRPTEKPRTVNEGVTQSMARLRAATDGGEVLGSWLEVWSSIAKLTGELLSLMAARGSR